MKYQDIPSLPSSEILRDRVGEFYQAHSLPIWLPNVAAAFCGCANGV